MRTTRRLGVTLLSSSLGDSVAKSVTELPVAERGSVPSRCFCQRAGAGRHPERFRQLFTSVWLPACLLLVRSDRMLLLRRPVGMSSCGDPMPQFRLTRALRSVLRPLATIVSIPACGSHGGPPRGAATGRSDRHRGNGWRGRRGPDCDEHARPAGLLRSVLGSVADEVVRTSRRSVLLVPRVAQPRPPGCCPT